MKKNNDMSIIVGVVTILILLFATTALADKSLNIRSCDPKSNDPEIIQKPVIVAQLYIMGGDNWETFLENLADPNGDEDRSDKLYDVVIHPWFIDDFNTNWSEAFGVPFIYKAHEEELKVGAEWWMFPRHYYPDGHPGRVLFDLDHTDPDNYLPDEFIAESINPHDGSFQKRNIFPRFHVDIANDAAVNAFLDRVEQFMERYLDEVPSAALDYYSLNELCLQRQETGNSSYDQSHLALLHYFHSPTYSQHALDHYQDWLWNQREVYGRTISPAYIGDDRTLWFFPILETNDSYG